MGRRRSLVNVLLRSTIKTVGFPISATKRDYPMVYCADTI